MDVGTAESRSGTNWRVLLAVCVVVSVSLAALVVFVPPENEDAVFCTLEGQIREDGSMWGRDPNNNCEFVPIDS